MLFAPSIGNANATTAAFCPNWQTLECASAARHRPGRMKAARPPSPVSDDVPRSTPVEGCKRSPGKFRDQIIRGPGTLRCCQASLSGQGLCGAAATSTKETANSLCMIKLFMGPQGVALLRNRSERATEACLWPCFSGFIHQKQHNKPRSAIHLTPERAPFQNPVD